MPKAKQIKNFREISEFPKISELPTLGGATAPLPPSHDASGGNFKRQVTWVGHFTSEIIRCNLQIFAKTIHQNLQATVNVYPKIVTTIQNFNNVSEI